jgi:hypothetical protein
MSTDDEILALRRATYRDAMRRGDDLAAARAAAALRAHLGSLGARDLAAVRASRQSFGRAIRDARARRVLGPVATDAAPAIALPRSRLRPSALLAALAALALALAGLFAQPLLDRSQDAEGGSGGAPAAAASDEPILLSALSRGRVIVAEVAVAAAVVEPVATPAPEPSASATPAPLPGAGAPSGSSAPSGSAGPGTGTGTGSGTGPGTGTRTASPAPTATRSPAPTLAACFASLPRGFARLCGLVVDSRTGRAISGACVSLGPCTDQSTRTDVNGRWAFVLPVGDGTLQWALEFAMAGYRTATYTQTSRQGYLAIPTHRLVAGP